jgi:drug/metabolite transporter (DMT)-like permease
MLWAASIVHNRSHRWCSTPFQLAPWQALLAAAILLPVAILFEGVPNVTWNATAAMLLYAGIPDTALAYWAAAVSSSELPASTTSLSLLATRAISILVALFLLSEQPTLVLMLALTLILIGMAVGMSGPAGGAPRR